MAAYSSFFFQIPQLPPTPSTSRGHRYAPSTASQFKSFLSLDIADSVRSRSSSTADIDNYSLLSETTVSSFFPTPIASSPRKSRTISRSSSTSSSARRALPRSSSSSSQSSAHRALPRPKPAPRDTIPEIPRPSYTRAHTTPATTRPRSRTGPSSSAPAPKSKPAPAPEPESASVPPPTPKPKPRPASTITATSTASTNYRRVKRTDALARLEGRIDTAVRAHSPPPYSPYAAVHRTKSAAPVLATKSFMPFSEEDSESESDDDDDDEANDVRVELELEFVPREREEKKGRRARAGTIDSWFVGPPPASAPAAPRNFMDFEDVDAAEVRYAKRGYL